ncbi:MAG: cysteine synthase family protein [Dehalococcoidia bacterium]|nr:cysteine synthase family protein [Dehalococcoidia bacterium]
MSTKANLLDAIGHTPLVELTRFSPKPEVRLFAKLEGQNPTGSLKDRIAKYMIEEAEASGRLTRDQIIIEATTGNTGIALAMVGRQKGYKVQVVMPENVIPEIRLLLEAYGAEVIWVASTLGTKGAIERVEQLAADEKYFAPRQFANHINALAHYETTGVEILEDLPVVDVFLAGLGTGGTVMGVGKRLKESCPQARIIAIEPHPDSLVHGLRSLEEGFIPPILDLTKLDGKFVVTSRDAFLATRALTEVEGIFAGISSGAVLHCALRVARRIKRGNIVMLFADGGWKYLSTGLWTKDIATLERDIEDKIWW